MTEAPAPRVGQARRPAVKRPWPKLPTWFWAGATAAFVGFLAVGVVAVVKVVSFTEQPLFERRSAPMASEQSHHVGRVVLPDAPITETDCGAVKGLRVQGGPDTGPLLRDALRGLCRRVAGIDTYGVELANRIKTLGEQRAIVSFANFGRTGELTTTLPGTPPRILLSDAFLRGGGQFKGFLLPELAHEMWHAGRVDITALDELTARRVEYAACRLIPSWEKFRGCTDAQKIVDAGEQAALEGLRAAGFR